MLHSFTDLQPLSGREENKPQDKRSWLVVQARVKAAGIAWDAGLVDNPRPAAQQGRLPREARDGRESIACP